MVIVSMSGISLTFYTHFCFCVWHYPYSFWSRCWGSEWYLLPKKGLVILEGIHLQWLPYETSLMHSWRINDSFFWSHQAFLLYFDCKFKANCKTLYLELLYFSIIKYNLKKINLSSDIDGIVTWIYLDK